MRTKGLLRGAQAVAVAALAAAALSEGATAAAAAHPAVAVNGAGNALVADPGNNRIRMILH